MSFYLYNTYDEVDRFIEELVQIISRKLLQYFAGACFFSGLKVIIFRELRRSPELRMVFRE